MKKNFIFFLCCSILLYGCYSLSPLTQEDLLALSSLPGRRIFVTLVDGSVIKSQPHYYFYTTEPGDFIFGFGKQKHRFMLREQTEFVGKLQRASIDSLKLIKDLNNRYLVCYLSDSTDIYYREGDYIMVTPEQSPGLWCAGILTIDGKESVFSGRIPNERIERIEMQKLSQSRTSFLIVGIAIFVGIIIFSKHLHFNNLDKLSDSHLKF